MTRDHLPPAARAAHGRMLDAFDAFMQGVLERERRAMVAHLQESGMTPERAAQGAQTHVQRIAAVLAEERARLEAEAVAHLH